MGVHEAVVADQESFTPLPDTVTIRMSRERYMEFLRFWLDHHPLLQVESRDGWGDQSEED